MWTIENWSLRVMISFFSQSVFSCTRSLSQFYLLEHISQELDSNTAKLLLKNQLKYPSLILSCQLELSFAFAFIHLPTGGDGRKSNDVRLIGIVVPIRIETRQLWKDDDIEDLSFMFKSRTLKEKKTTREKGKEGPTVQYHDRNLFACNVVRKQLVMFVGFRCLVWSIFRMDKVLVYIIKNEKKNERHSVSIIEWHRSRLRLRFITSNQPVFSWEIVFLFFSFLMMDQTSDIFSHRALLFSQARSDI